MQGNGRGNTNLLERKRAAKIPHEANQFESDEEALSVQLDTTDVRRDAYCGAKGQPWKTFIHRFVLAMDEHIFAGESLSAIHFTALMLAETDGLTNATALTTTLKRVNGETPS